MLIIKEGTIFRGVMVRTGYEVSSGRDITQVEFPEYLSGSHQYQLPIGYTIYYVGKIMFEKNKYLVSIF